MIIKLLRSLFVLLICFFVSPSARAQTEQVVEVDRDLGITKVGFPYDQEFFVKFFYDTRPRISYIELREGNKNFKSIPLKNKVTGKDVVEQRLEFTDSTILATIVKFNIVESDKKFAVLVPMPRLRPDKDYKIVLYNSLSEKEIQEDIEKGFKAHEQGNTFQFSVDNLARQLVVDVRQTRQLTNAQFSSGKATTQALTQANKGSVAPNGGIDPAYKLLVDNEYQVKISNTYESAKVPLRDYHSITFNHLLGELQDNSVKTAINNLLDQIKIDAMKTDTQSVVPTTLQLILTTLKHTATINPVDFNDYAIGRRSLITFPYVSPVDALGTRPSVPVDLAAKTEANLSSSIKALAQLRLYAQATRITDPNQTKLIAFCGDLIAMMQQKQKALIKLAEIYDELVNEMRTDQRLVSAENTTINSSSREVGFDARAKVQIIPDFGLAYYSALSDPLDYNHRNFNGFTPFLGVNVSLAPINKDVPIRLLRGMPGSLYRRFSLFAGITLNSIAKDKERKDLFGNKSLLAGISFRLSNAIRISTGALVFNAKNSNPLISRYHAGAVPYVALSLDLSLREIAKDFTSLILPAN